MDDILDFHAFTELGEAFQGATKALDDYIAVLNSPNVRRWVYEAEVGYSVPDWVWNAMELERRTFGSGNGRVLRD